MLPSLEIVGIVVAILAWGRVGRDVLGSAWLSFAFLCLAVVCEALRLHFGG